MVSKASARPKPSRTTPDGARLAVLLRKQAKMDVLFAIPPFADPRIKGDFRIWEGVFGALQRSDDGSAHVAASILIRVVEQMTAEYDPEHVIEALRNMADDMEGALNEPTPEVQKA